jgi:hypothetical protein
MNFKTLESAARYRLVENMLRKWFGKDQRGLLTAVAQALRASKKGEELAKQIRAAVDCPVSYGLGIFHSAESELSRCLRTGELLDMSLIGDLSSSYEIVLSGPTRSPIRLDSIMERRKSSEAVVCELWVSHFFPVYVFDVYRKGYDRLTRTWRFEPVIRANSVPGGELIRKAERVLAANGFVKVSKKFCALPIPTPHLKCYPGTPRVFDCLFTTTAGGMRLEFNKKGFRTSIIRVGSNWSMRDNIIFEGVADKAIPGIRISWKEKLNHLGKVVGRVLSYSYPDGDVLSIETKGEKKVSSIRVNIEVVWKKSDRIDSSW